jgi:Arc/MetJ-type ribon-helix-helix transcriptional regulator
MAEPKTFTLRVRLSETQRERLQRIADDRFGGSMSDAVRQAITDAEVLRMARVENLRLLKQGGAFIPRDENGESSWLEQALSPMTEFSDEPWSK